MPSALTYPGIYVEEIPSGVRTITGVATSITAFIGWIPQGPTDKAERIHSFSEFHRCFGGLHAKSLLSYSVQHFFDNGGSDAYIIRLVAADAKEGKLVGVTGLELEAKNQGEWSNFIGVRITKRKAEPPEDKRFRLEVLKFPKDSTGKPDTKATSNVLETFENLSMEEDDKRFVKEVVNGESDYIKVTKAKGNVPETDPPKLLTGGFDGKVLDPTVQEFLDGVKELANNDTALDHIDLFNLLCVPGLTEETTLTSLQQFCQKRRAFLIADCKPDAKAVKLATDGPKGLTMSPAINAAFYFPWVNAPDPLSEGRKEDFPPCGFVAGIYARTDAARGVWKAPAGTEASLVGAMGPKGDRMTDLQNGDLNIKAINCIRDLPVYGTVLWGARTLHGDNERGSEWKYIPVRRTALFIEETLYRNLKWVVFEPNDEPLWAQIRLNVGAFMHDLFRQHAFQGETSREAYFVKCDKETTTQNDIDHGIVNILVGFAPLKPAEFVVVKIQQIAGQIET